jgi:hypothetical protein
MSGLIYDRRKFLNGNRISYIAPGQGLTLGQPTYYATSITPYVAPNRWPAIGTLAARAPQVVYLTALPSGYPRTDWVMYGYSIVYHQEYTEYSFVYPGANSLPASETITEDWTSFGIVLGPKDPPSTSILNSHSYNYDYIPPQVGNGPTYGVFYNNGSREFDQLWVIDNPYTDEFTGMLDAFNEAKQIIESARAGITFVDICSPFSQTDPYSLDPAYTAVFRSDYYNTYGFSGLLVPPQSTFYGTDFLHIIAGYSPAPYLYPSYFTANLPTIAPSMKGYSVRIYMPDLQFNVPGIGGYVQGTYDDDISPPPRDGSGGPGLWTADESWYETNQQIQDYNSGKTSQSQQDNYNVIAPAIQAANIDYQIVDTVSNMKGSDIAQLIADHYKFQLP